MEQDHSHLQAGWAPPCGSRPSKPKSRPPLCVSEEVIEGYAAALQELAQGLPLPMTSGHERGQPRYLGDAAAEAGDRAGALRFAPQVVQRTGITPERIEETLDRRAALLMLRDVALRVAIGSADSLALLDAEQRQDDLHLVDAVVDPDGPGRAQSADCAALEAAARRGEAADAVCVSQAVAAERLDD